jgi:hypothetical protein
LTVRSLHRTLHGAGEFRNGAGPVALSKHDLDGLLATWLSGKVLNISIPSRSCASIPRVGG